MKPSTVKLHPCLRLLEQCKSSRTLKQAHAVLITTGLTLHSLPLSRLLHFSSIFLGPLYAITVFRRFPRPATAFLYNTLISSFAVPHTGVAWDLYSELAAKEDCGPNSYTYPSLFKVCEWAPGRALQAHVVKFLGNTHDRFVQTALLDFYGRCGRLETCRYLFNRIPQPDLAAWNSLLTAYSRGATAAAIDDETISLGSPSSGLCSEALRLFRQMQLSGVKHDEITLVAVIGISGEAGALAQGAWAHACIYRRNRLVLNHYLGAALTEMYSKCGRFDLACQLFDNMASRDTPCYNSIIGASAVYGHGLRALELFERMIRDGLKPNDRTMVSMLSACSHAGLVDEGRSLFHNMTKQFGIERDLEHYNCMVDILGRAGYLDEAEKTIQRMPMCPNATTYRAVLSAYRIHGKLDAGKHVLQNLMKLEPNHGANYVLLSNVYANSNRWIDVMGVRVAMRDVCNSKNPGISSIEVNGVVYEFKTADRSHSCSEDIYVMLEDINQTT